MRNLKKVFAITFLFILLGTTLGICQPELIPYRKGNEWGFCDRNKKIVIPIKYDDVGSFSEGLARVELNGKWGYIDKEGKEVIPIKYDWARSFSEGLACVKLNGKYGYIDKEGKEVIPCKYDDAGCFSEGLACVELNGKWGYIDKEGKEYFENLQESAKKVVEEWLQAQKRGEWGDIYWTNPLFAKSLYAVREWEIVNCLEYKDTAYVIARISSSTKGGFPIIVLWRFTLKKQPNGDWKISNLTEAQ